MNFAFFSNTDFFLINFREKLMEKAKEKGDVFVCATETKRETAKRIEEKFNFERIPLKRSVDLRGGDLLYMFRVFRFCRKEDIDLAHNFTIKPCIFGSLAQKLAGVENIYCTITGLGHVFQDKDFKDKILLKIVVFLYRLAFKFVDKVNFLNPDDQELFLKKNILPEEKAVLIKSCGVDVEEFNPDKVSEQKRTAIKEELEIEDEVVITVVSRMLKQKGIGDLVEATEKLTNNYNIKVLLVGPADEENPDGIPQKTLEDWSGKSYINWTGEVSNVREILAVTDIFTLPSYYREGIPKVLLEAGAMKLPLVTTDWVGCKETVQEGDNGYLIEPQNGKQLTGKLKELIIEKNKRERMGEKSRNIITSQFSEKRVVEETFRMYGF